MDSPDCHHDYLRGFFVGFAIGILMEMVSLVFGLAVWTYFIK